MREGKEEEVAILWNGYGKITRLLSLSSHPRICKQVAAPSRRGTRYDEGHARKLRSYEVERFFYSTLSSALSSCKVATLHERGPDFMILEDLAVDYPLTYPSFDARHGKAVLTWLAHFHATYWSQSPPTVPCPSEPFSGQGVWSQGGYWYLATRQDEYDSLTPEWQAIAETVDQLIRNVEAKYQTLIHGDCKAANILFGETGEVAMVDFQYVGISLPARDLVYFLVSSMQSLTEHLEMELLEFYHEILLGWIKEDYPFDLFMEHYELCMVDYYRFMLGWGLWGNHQYAARRVKHIMNTKKFLKTQ